MGAWGYGVFESDNALDMVYNVMEAIGEDKSTKLLNGTVINESWTPSLGLLHHSIASKILKNCSAIEKYIVNDDFGGTSEKYLVLAELFNMHNLQLPKKTLNKAIKEISSMLDTDGDIYTYDAPNARKAVVMEVLNTLKAQKLESTLQKELENKPSSSNKKIKI